MPNHNLTNSRYGRTNACIFICIGFVLLSLFSGQLFPRLERQPPDYNMFKPVLYMDENKQVHGHDKIPFWTSTDNYIQRSSENTFTHCDSCHLDKTNVNITSYFSSMIKGEYVVVGRRYEYYNNDATYTISYILITNYGRVLLSNCILRNPLHPPNTPTCPGAKGRPCGITVYRTLNRWIPKHLVALLKITIHHDVVKMYTAADYSMYHYGPLMKCVESPIMIYHQDIINALESLLT